MKRKYHFDYWRKKAESMLDEESLNKNSLMQIKELIYELSVSQIELELQNEELHKLQHELTTTAEMYRELFENEPLPYLIIDNDGIITDANASSLALFQLNKEFLTNRPLDSFFNPNDAGNIDSYLKNVFSNDDSAIETFTVISKDKKIEFHSNRYTDKLLGKVLCRAVLIDVTQNFNTQNELDSLRDKLNAIIKSMDDVLFIHNLDGKIINIWTHSDKDLFKPKDELIGKTHYDIF